MPSMAFVLAVLHGFADCPIASAAAPTEPRRPDGTGCCTHVIVQAQVEMDVFGFDMDAAKLALITLANTTEMYFAKYMFDPEHFRYTSTHTWTCIVWFTSTQAACISRFEFLSDDFVNVVEQHVDIWNASSTVNVCPLTRSEQRGQQVVIVCEDQMMTLEYAGLMMSVQLYSMVYTINFAMFLGIILMLSGYAQAALILTAALLTVFAVLVVAYEYIAPLTLIFYNKYPLLIMGTPLCSWLIMALWWDTRRRRRAYLNVVEGGLPDLLADGSIRLLSIDWLLKQSDNYVISRCQDLPAEAFVECGVAVSMLSAGRRIAVMSYGWLTALHPDPDSFHLRALVSFLRRQRGKHNLQALFLDFASLPQKDSDGERSTEDDRKFKAALKEMSSLYATPRTIVLQHSALPSSPPDLRPYFATDKQPGRGWCYSEHHTALTVVARSHLINLVSGPVRSTCRDRVSPIQMRDTLMDETKIQFTGRGDAENVANLYAAFYRRVTDYEMSVDLLFKLGWQIFFAGRMQTFQGIALAILLCTVGIVVSVHLLGLGGYLVVYMLLPLGLLALYIYTKRTASYFGVDRRLVHPEAAPGAEPDPEAYGAGAEPEAAAGPAAEPEILS